MKKIYLILLLLVAASCGFKAGSSVIKTSDGVIETMSIDMFDNKTNRAGVEAVLSEEFSREFSNSVEIADDNSKVDAKLIGIINNYAIEPLAVDSNGIVTSYRLVLDFTVTITRTDSGEVLWNESFSDYEDFDVDRSGSSTAILTTKDREWEMLGKMARDRARIFKETVLENFK